MLERLGRISRRINPANWHTKSQSASPSQTKAGSRLKRFSLPIAATLITTGTMIGIGMKAHKALFNPHSAPETKVGLPTTTFDYNSAKSATEKPDLKKEITNISNKLWKLASSYFPNTALRAPEIKPEKSQPKTIALPEIPEEKKYVPITEAPEGYYWTADGNLERKANVDLPPDEQPLPGIGTPEDIARINKEYEEASRKYQQALKDEEKLLTAGVSGINSPELSLKLPTISKKSDTLSNNSTFIASSKIDRDVREELNKIDSPFHSQYVDGSIPPTKPDGTRRPESTRLNDKAYLEYRANLRMQIAEQEATLAREIAKSQKRQREIEAESRIARQQNQYGQPSLISQPHQASSEQNLRKAEDRFIDQVRQQRQEKQSLPLPSNARFNGGSSIPIIVPPPEINNIHQYNPANPVPLNEAENHFIRQNSGY